MVSDTEQTAHPFWSGDRRRSASKSHIPYGMQVKKLNFKFSSKQEDEIMIVHLIKDNVAVSSVSKHLQEFQHDVVRLGCTL